MEDKKLKYKKYLMYLFFPFTWGGPFGLIVTLSVIDIISMWFCKPPALYYLSGLTGLVIGIILGFFSKRIKFKSSI